MYKEDLLYLHQFLNYLMRLLVDSGVPEEYFREYRELGISPHHIHRKKSEQMYAIFVLARDISRVLAESNSMPGSMAEKFSQIAERERLKLQAQESSS